VRVFCGGVRTVKGLPEPPAPVRPAAATAKVVPLRRLRG